jgi:transcriptional regulator with GAF, ATPase, and Fis domain
LIVAGLLLSPPGTEWMLAAVNRMIGLATIWFSAFMVRHTLFTRLQLAHNAWLEEGQSRIAKAGVGDLRPQDIASAQLSALVEFVDAQVGALYRREGEVLVRIAQYAVGVDAAAERLRMGEGIAGEVARSGKPMVVRTLPGDYLRIMSATGSGSPQALIAAPITTDGQLFGLIELGFMRTLADDDGPVDRVERLGADLGSSLRSALYRERVDMLLEETQRQSAELEERQEELKAANEELEEQSKSLQESQARLENQQAELEETNAQLEAYTADLERQKQELLRTQRALNESALALERSSR